MLPGQFDTDRLQSNHQKFAAARNVPLQQFQDEARELVPAKRFGTPAEFGAVCAFLCSAHAGYITGQNILLDGGQYPGLM
jgi:3-oxoacyl-[acyl-carrier protein] reductase